MHIDSENKLLIHTWYPLILKLFATSVKPFVIEAGEYPGFRKHFYFHVSECKVMEAIS